MRYATLDSTIALMFALSINASILILAAATFHKSGNTGVEELDQAHQLLGAAARRGDRADPVRASRCLLRPQLDGDGDAWPARSSWRASSTSACRAWLRRLITRAVAIVPAVLVTLLYGDSGTAKLLILSAR